MAEKNSLWRNIRKKAEQNRRTGAKPKKPTAEMLRQERKIKAKQYLDGGPFNPDRGTYANKQGVIMGPVQNSDGTYTLPVSSEGLPQVNLPEFEVVSTPTGYAPGQVIEERRDFKPWWNWASKKAGDVERRQDAYGKLGDLYAYYSGQPLKYNVLEYSKYKPENAKNKDSKYIAINDAKFKQEIIDKYNEVFKNERLENQKFLNERDFKRLNQQGKLESTKINDSTYSVSGYTAATDDDYINAKKYNLDPLKIKGTKHVSNAIGRYFLSKGKDNKGEYISYYDVFDQGSGSGSRGGLGAALGLTKPFEIYDRIYLDSKTGKPIIKADGGPVGDDGLYNMQRALELKYTPDKTGHWPSVDSETGAWLKSKEHPTAWMEYMYGYALNPEVQKQYQHPVVNPEGYFGENQLQYNLKAKGGQYLTVDGQAHRVYRNADDDIMVNHPKEDLGKWDTINLTDKSGANTIAEGVASVRKWHRENPSYAQGGHMYPDGGKTKVYTDPKEFKKAERAYNDSLSAYKAGKDFFDEFSNSSNPFKRVTPNQYHIEAAKDNFNTNINPSEIYEDVNGVSDTFIPLWKKPEIKPVLGKPTVDKLQSKQYSNFSSNQQPSIVGNVENISPSEINMDKFYDGQYEKYRRSPYEDPMYRVWVPGQQMQIVSKEEFEKLNDQYALKDLEQKAQGGYMYPDGGSINPGKQKAVASTTAVNTRALPEGLFEQVKLNPPARQPEIINIVDKRKWNPVTNKPINDKVDLVGGKFEDTIINEIINSASKHGVDPYIALAVGLQESRLGKTDPNIGHIRVDPYSDYIPGAEDMVLMIKEKQDYAKKLGYNDQLHQIQAYNGLGPLSKKKGEVNKSAYGITIPEEGLDLIKNPLYGKKIINIADSVLKQNPQIVRRVEYYKPKMDGGYMYYAGGPMYYGDGGKVLKHIGAGAYGILEGGLDTLTFGATDKLTDKGFDWLTKVGNKNLDLNDPKNAKFLRTQQQIRGYSNVAGAIGTAAFTGQWGSAIGQSAKGVNTAFQATEGLSDDFKKWSNISSQAIGIGAGLAGGSLNVESASKAGQAAANFGSQVSKYAPYANQGLGMIGGNQQSLLEQAEARQDYLNSPEYLAMKERENQAYVNQGLSFASTGGNINNSLNLQNSMRGKYNNYKRRYSKGGTFQKFGINEIPDSAGYHHENAYGGVPIGPNAMAEGGEFVLDNNYVVSDEVDGMNTQTDEFGRTMAQNLKKDLSKYTMRDLNSKNRDSLRRPMDPLAEQTINQIKQKAMMETEMARAEAQAKEQERQAMVNGALQYAAAGGKLNKDITKIVEEEYAAAYGGYINPKKYKGLNMPYSSGGKLPKEVLRARVESHMSPQEADAYVENYAKGGSIHIKESKKGTFTAAAKKRGKSVQEFARQVLANKGNYSSAMVKKANFARNAAKWHHAEGGNIRPDNPGFNALPEYVQAKIMNNMAHGGPVVSNVPQDFDLYAQNRGGMMMAQGGNMYFSGGGIDSNIIGPIDYSFHMPTGSDVIEDLPGFTFDPSVTNKVPNNAFDLNNPSFTFVNPAVYNNEISEIQDLPGYVPSVNVSNEAIGLNDNVSDLPLNFTEKSAKKYGLNPDVNNINIVSDPKVNQPKQPNEGLTGLDYASMGMQALPYFYQTAVGLKGGDPVNYERVTGEKIDPTVAIALAAEEGRRAQDSAAYLMRQNAPTSGSYMNNLRNLSLQSGKQRAALAGGLRYQADLTNTQMQNELNKVNAGISMQEQIDRLQEKDAARTNITEGLSGLGSTTANVIRDYRTNQINQMIAKNIGTNNYKYDPINQTITYRTQNGEMVTVPAQTVIPPNVAVNVGTGQIQQPGTPQLKGFEERLNESFRNRFMGPNAGNN